ncbi:MAG: riboflavin synthase [Deltaproteobacteria bacterium]|nr:riboflavin synthase [Deltaproteobacteria bacterium]
MFTGLIEGLGKVGGIRRSRNDMKVTIIPPFDAIDCEIGESISVNGVCLTVTEISGNALGMDVSGETLSRSTLRFLKMGDSVNLERALRLTDRLGGHLVAGHVDGVGTIVGKDQSGQSWRIRIRIEQGLSRYLIVKGSIAVDGISLTINACENDLFEVNIIPQTGVATTLLKKKTGDPVNIETDLIGKYVEKLFSRGRPDRDTEASGIDLEALAKHGFIR